MFSSCSPSNAYDGAELEQRKVAARATAESEHAPLSALDAAYSTYMAAVAARVVAEDEAERALAAEDRSFRQRSRRCCRRQVRQGRRAS